MPTTIKDIRQAREMGLQMHRDWKGRIAVNDAVANDEWSIIWDDDVEERSEPLVENVYSGSLEDKVSTAASKMPAIFVHPTRGTRKDRGERNAQLKRRAMVSYWRRSRQRKVMRSGYLDYFHAGATYFAPWTLWFDRDGTPIPSAGRFPFALRLDPRQAYPLSHNSIGDVTSIFFARQRRVQDLEQEYGKGHPTLRGLRANRAKMRRDPAEFFEEMWWFDETHWGVAITDSMVPKQYAGHSFLPEPASALGTVVTDWITPPTAHNLTGCPVTEIKRMTHNGSYRGAIEDVIPTLKVAQNFMARLLDDLAQNIYAPVVLDNIENDDEYGSGAILVGTGEGKANIIRDRPPVNFEAQRTISELINTAHRQAAWPVQRSGDPDASIVSAKGVVALAGTFNAELATAQGEFEEGLTRTNSMLANLDEIHCPGTKQIDGVDAGEAFTETYNPQTLYNGDYRNVVSYGDGTGLDEQQRLIRLAMVKNLDGISTRTFMEKAGTSEDPLQEERDVMIEKLTSLFTDVLLPQQIQSGDIGSLKAFVDKIDTDEMTVRAAVIETIQEAMAPAPGVGTAGGPAPGAPPQDALLQGNSLEQGGIPGNAAGQPPQPPRVGPSLQRALPPQVSRQIAEISPGR